MDLNIESQKELYLKMLAVKIGTLIHHLPEKEVDRYYGCDFEFKATVENTVPTELHTWVGKNH